ncbi:hypothetical protein MUK42_36776 [Musa troglodytarum]|uniref:Uncharacterized protein n=1 Tax=Musa troglodytarum TaxID=320322 RepID=A0A9E7GHN8_9LILI|nr:hypothetical protein MUK42_36776 [Musa troglodytarum]
MFNLDNTNRTKTSKIADLCKCQKQGNKTITRKYLL